MWSRQLHEMLHGMKCFMDYASWTLPQNSSMHAAVGEAPATAATRYVHRTAQSMSDAAEAHVPGV
jgi:hypothetical protein